MNSRCLVRPGGLSRVLRAPNVSQFIHGVQKQDNKFPSYFKLNNCHKSDVVTSFICIFQTSSVTSPTRVRTMTSAATTTAATSHPTATSSSKTMHTEANSIRTLKRNMLTFVKNFLQVSVRNIRSSIQTCHQKVFPQFSLASSSLASPMWVTAMLAHARAAQHFEADVFDFHRLPHAISASNPTSHFQPAMTSAHPCNPLVTSPVRTAGAHEQTLNPQTHVMTSPLALQRHMQQLQMMTQHFHFLSRLAHHQGNADVGDVTSRLPVDVCSNAPPSRGAHLRGFPPQPAFDLQHSGSIQTQKRLSDMEPVTSLKSRSLSWIRDLPPVYRGLAGKSEEVKATAAGGLSRRQHEAPRYHCEACRKSYATFSGLSKHKQFHCESHVKKEFSCKFCEKTYNSLGALKMHIRTHTLPCKCHHMRQGVLAPVAACKVTFAPTQERSRSRVTYCGRAFRGSLQPARAPADAQWREEVQLFGLRQDVFADVAAEQAPRGKLSRSQQTASPQPHHPQVVIPHWRPETDTVDYFKYMYLFSVLVNVLYMQGTCDCIQCIVK